MHLQNLRKQVLAGVHIVFSHVIPLEKDMTQHHLWRLATQVLCLATTSPESDKNI